MTMKHKDHARYAIVVSSIPHPESKSNCFARKSFHSVRISRLVKNCKSSEERQMANYPVNANIIVKNSISLETEG